MSKQNKSLEDMVSTKILSNRSDESEIIKLKENVNERKRRFSFVNNARDLEKFESVRRWLSRVRQDGTGSEITSYTYLRHLNLYCGYLKKDPDRLIEEREQELKSDREKVKRHAEEVLREFCDHLEREEKLSGATMKSIFGAIKSFYKANYQPLLMGTPVRATKQVLPAKREEILKMLHYANVRDRAIILAFKDSGVSREDLVTLKYGDIRDEFEKGIMPIHVSLVRGKEKIRYETFLGKDFFEAYKPYLDLRKRKGESITADSPLFVCGYDASKPLTVSALAGFMWRLQNKSSADVTPHGLRKFFITSVSLALPRGSPAYLPKYWAGHSLGVESAYFIPPVEEQREAYRQAYEKLAITPQEKALSEEEIRKKAIIDQARLLHPDRQDLLEKITKLIKSAPSVEVAIDMIGKLYGSRELEPLVERAKRRSLLPRGERRGKPLGEWRIVNNGEAEQNGGTNNGTFKIIEENELIPMLEQGYEIVKELSNGKIVVKKPGNCLF